MIFVDLHTGKEISEIGVSTVIAIGNFDGFHKGHFELAKETKMLARNLSRENKKAASCVWTFASPPQDYLLGKGAVPQLTSKEQKIKLFAEAGLDYAVFGNFEKLRYFSPEKFAEEVLLKECRAEAVVCGFNFRFGCNGEGNAELLEKYFSSIGKRAIVVPPVYWRDNIISSTLIRSKIENGETEEAAEMLGRPFFVDFPVAHGKMLGRTIEIPTANQKFPDGYIIPKKGVYASLCSFDGKRYIGVSNVGCRPTVENGANINCETHIVDYNGDLYGKKIKIEFFKRLRDERKFADVKELKAAVEKDIEAAKKYFNEKTRSNSQM